MQPDEPIVNPDLEMSIEQTSGIKPEVAAVDNGPLYRKMKDSKVLVSKSLGKLWKSRIDQSTSARRDSEIVWSEAISYYNNDQMSHRTSNGGERSGNRRGQRNINDGWSETENVVFSNAVTLLPMLYAKNPQIETTAVDQTNNEEWAKCCEKLVNTLLSMKTAPGLNAKSKARRTVLWTLLTNNAYSKVDFIKKDEGSQTAFEELQRLSNEYANAKDQKEIKALEGKIAALEEKVNILSPSGPTFKVVNPFRLLIDPQSIEPDHSDANWMAEYDYLPTAYINAVYGKPAEGEDNKYVSVYEPTHILNSGQADGGIDEDVNNFSLFNKEQGAHTKYGYEDEATYLKASYTKVWWVWDKTTRRVFLYANNNWTWPLWVWDDPLGLVEFFPYDHLWFHETPEGSQPKGEVTYYLDQQDAINDMNSAIAQARTWARLKVFFDKNKTNQDEVMKLINSDMNGAVGIDVPEGGKMEDVVWSFVPPAIRMTELFNVDSKFAAINRITGISSAQRGAEFKTNTTNDAIDFYQKSVDIRIDEKIDAIEDWIGMIAWKVLQLCVKHWSVEDVAAIIGKEAAAPWKQITDPSELRTKLLIRIVGGSTDKPTSKNKKKAALEISQVLGQFANAIPAAGVVSMKVLSRAFADDIVITNEDWDMIFQTMQAQQQKAGAGPGGEQAPPEGEDPEAMTPEKEQQLKDMIKSLPPEAQQQMEQMIQSGASPTEALQAVMQPQ